MIRSTLEFWNSGHTTDRNTGILPKYRNTRENTGIPVKTPILALIKKRIYSENDPENRPIPLFPQINFISLFSAASDLGLRCLHKPICSNI